MLQTRGIVVARTDVVAHSMGGLLLRSYSSGATYRSVENREQGQFHTIVTLDTPEAGSKMASYLWNNQDDTLEATDSSDPEAYHFWSAVCGSNPTTTVGQCLAKTNPVTGGGLQSLMPGSASLLKAPPPTIADATWIAITATNTSGIARRAVSDLIRATYANYFLAPTINHILGGINDDVVSLTSQLTGNPPVYVTDKGLAHVGFLRYGIDEGVNNSALAAGQTSCWLQDPSSPACATMAENTSSLATAGPPVEEDAEFRIRQGRLAPVPLPASVALGKALNVHIKAAPGVKSFQIDQYGAVALPGYMVDSHHDTFKVEPSSSGEYDITVYPRVVGRATVDIGAYFIDGGFDEVHSTTKILVDPDDIVSVSAAPGLGDRKFPIQLDMAAPSLDIQPEIRVKGVPDSIEVAAFATYRVLPSSGEPIIKIDSHGRITALRPGVATVDVDFEGHSDTVPVVVLSGDQ